MAMDLEFWAHGRQRGARRGVSVRDGERLFERRRRRISVVEADPLRLQPYTIRE